MKDHYGFLLRVVDGLVVDGRRGLIAPVAVLDVLGRELGIHVVSTARVLALLRLRLSLAAVALVHLVVVPVRRSSSSILQDSRVHCAGGFESDRFNIKVADRQILGF